MASIRKRKIKWQVVIRRKGYPTINRSFLRHIDALEWARLTESQIDRRDLSPSLRSLNSLRVRDIIERYRDEVSVKKRSHNTEIFILNAFLRHKLADHPLAQINAADFYSYREARLKQVKPGTVNRELSILSHAFDIAIREWQFPLRENPLANIKKLKVNNARNRRLIKDELTLIINQSDQCRNKLIRPIILFALETAMRRGEILNAKWEHINWTARTLFIPETKNGHSRTIPLTLKAIDILNELDRDKAKIFPASAEAVKLAWKRLIKRGSIPDLHFHDLRHESISRFFERGLSVPEVALISGHRDYRMLFRYTHLKAEDVANKLNAYPPTQERKDHEYYSTTPSQAA